MFLICLERRKWSPTLLWKCLRLVPNSLVYWFIRSDAPREKRSSMSLVTNRIFNASGAINFSGFIASNKFIAGGLSSWEFTNKSGLKNKWFQLFYLYRCVFFFFTRCRRRFCLCSLIFGGFRRSSLLLKSTITAWPFFAHHHLVRHTKRPLWILRFKRAKMREISYFNWL